MPDQNQTRDAREACRRPGCECGGFAPALPESAASSSLPDSGGTVTVQLPRNEAEALALDAIVEHELAARAVKRVGEAITAPSSSDGGEREALMAHVAELEQALRLRDDLIKRFRRPVPGRTAQEKIQNLTIKLALAESRVADLEADAASSSPPAGGDEDTRLRDGLAAAWTALTGGDHAGAQRILEAVLAGADVPAGGEACEVLRRGRERIAADVATPGPVTFETAEARRRERIAQTARVAGCSLAEVEATLRPAAGEGRAPRVSLWSDGLGISIGLGVSNDTLLRLGGGDAAGYNPQVDRDRGDMLVLREWVDAVNRLLPAVPNGGQTADAVSAPAEQQRWTERQRPHTPGGRSFELLASDEVRYVVHTPDNRVVRLPMGIDLGTHPSLDAAFAAAEDHAVVVARGLIKRGRESIADGEAALAFLGLAAPVEGDGRDAREALLRERFRRIIDTLCREVGELAPRSDRVERIGAAVREGVALLYPVEIDIDDQVEAAARAMAAAAYPDGDDCFETYDDAVARRDEMSQESFDDEVGAGEEDREHYRHMARAALLAIPAAVPVETGDGAREEDRDGA